MRIGLYDYMLFLCFGNLSAQAVNERTWTITYTGRTTSVICPSQQAFTLPRWTGPPRTISGAYTIITREGSETINPAKPRIKFAADMRSLLVDNTELSDDGIYRCTKQNLSFTGENTVYVRILPDQPEITSSVQVNNKSVKATEGRELTITCISRGGYPLPTVAWYYGNTTGQLLVQSNTGIEVDGTYIVTLPYTFTPNRQDDMIQLMCRSYWPTPADASGSMEQSISLYMYLKPLQPRIIQTTDVVAGDTVSVECRTSGSRPEANISWTYKGQTHTTTAIFTNDTATQTFTTLSVLRRSVTATDNGQMVVCRVSHMALDNDLTASVSLNVLFSVGRSTTTITGNSVTVANSINQLPLKCTTGSSNPSAVIIWKHGTDIIPNNNTYTNNNGSNNGVVSSQTLILTPTRHDHGVSISCYATNGVSQFTDTTAVTLNLNFSPVVSISTISRITLTEQSFQSPTLLPCSVVSNPPARITWYHNDRAVTSTILGSYLSYTIRGGNRTSYGNYTCMADNSVPPSDSKTYAVEVLFGPLEATIKDPTVNVIANGNNSMSISCTSGTSNPVSEIYWTTANIQTDRPNHVDNPGEYGGIVRTSTIRFNPTRDHDGATVTCQARNNVTGQREVSSSTVIDNIIYPPLIADIPARNVTEGDSVMLPCQASSKPPANLTWRKGSFEVANSLNNVLYNGPNYTIHNTSRTQAGTYICTADNQIQPSDNKQTLLTVLYPPDVFVYAVNKTVNSSQTTVTCNASGVPDQYEFDSWVHTWNGHVVTHPRGLPATRVLTLTNLSYAHSGVYTCGATNGVKGVSYGTGSLLVKSPPIVVGDVTNRMEIKASGQLMKTITVMFRYYSNAGRGSVTVQKTNSTAGDVGAVQLRDVNTTLPVFLSEITTSMVEATMNIAVTNMSQFGDYDVFVMNDMGRVQLSLIIQPLGPPETPDLLNSTVLNHQSVTIVWISGFPNGLKQTFVIQLSTDKTTWRNITEYGGMAYQQTHSKTIDSLASNHLYFVRMLAFNAEGDSELSSTLSFVTTAAPATDPDSASAAMIGGAVTGGLAGAVGIVFVIVVTVWKRRCSPLPGGNHCGKSTGKRVEAFELENKSNVGETRTEVMTTECIDAQPYEALNATRDTQCYEQLHTNRTDNPLHVYENASPYETLRRDRESEAKTYDELQLYVPEHQNSVYENLKLAAL